MLPLFTILNSRRIWIILLAEICCLHGYTSNPFDENQVDREGLFDRETLLEFELHLPLDSLLYDTGEDPGYHDGTLVYYDSTGTRIEFGIEARARGHFRKNPANCNFPPLKLKFKKKTVTGTVFEGLKDIKMITHCKVKTLIMSNMFCRNT